MQSSPSKTYTKVAITFHWITLLAIVIQFVLGYFLDDKSFTPFQTFQLFQLHKSFGITILFLFVLRLVWRLFNPPPALPETLTNPEKKIAQATHWLLYALLFTLPITGWIIISSSPLNIPTYLFGFLYWPHIPFLSTLSFKKELSETMGDIHSALATIFLIVIALHSLAALRHHFLLGDDILKRMIPWLSIRQARKLKD